MFHLEIFSFFKSLFQERRETFDFAKRSFEVVRNGVGEGFELLGLAHEGGASLAEICQHGRQRIRQDADFVSCKPGFKLGREVVAGDAICRGGKPFKWCCHEPLHHEVDRND